MLSLPNSVLLKYVSASCWFVSKNEIGGKETSEPGMS